MSEFLLQEHFRFRISVILARRRRFRIVLNSRDVSCRVGVFGVVSRAELLFGVAELRNAAKAYLSFLIVSM